MTFWFMLAGWIGCGVITYGISLHYFQMKYSFIADQDLASDRVGCSIAAVFGPLSLIAFLIVRSLMSRIDREPPPRIGWRW